MSTMAIRPAVSNDLDVCWDVFLESATRSGGPAPDAGAKAPFAARWKTTSNCVVEIDGNPAGWFACVIDPSTKDVTVQDMHFRAGNVGVPHLVLSIIAKNTASRGRTALWSVPKGHPAAAVFKTRAFPLHSETADYATIKVATYLERADDWGSAGNANLPWNKA